MRAVDQQRVKPRFILRLHHEGLKNAIFFFFFFFSSPHDVMVVSRCFPLLFSKLTSLVVFSKTASSFPPLLCFPRPLRVYFPCCIFQDGFKQDLVTSPEVYSKTASSLLPLLCFPRLLETSVQCLQREFHAYCFCCFQSLFHARLLFLFLVLRISESVLDL